MYIWQISLAICLSMIPIGVLLRKIADSTINNNLSWTKYGVTILKEVFKKNVFVGFLIALEGIISNLALVGFIVGIPLYFIFKI